MRRFSIWQVILLTALVGGCSAAKAPNEPAGDGAVEASGEMPDDKIGAPIPEKVGTAPGQQDFKDGEAAGMQPKPRMADKVSWCAAVGIRTSMERCAGYTEEVANLSNGIAAFDPPRQMTTGQTEIVRLAIARDSGSRPTRAEEMIGGGATTETRDVVIGAKMRAEIIGGRAFEIDPQGPQDKFMGRSREKAWSWNVTPKLSGKHSLSATITVLAEDGTILDNFESRPITIMVAVSDAEAQAAKRDRTRKDLAWYEEVGRLLTNLWWVWIGLAIAIAVGVWRFIRAARTGTDPAVKAVIPEEKPVEKEDKGKKPSG